MLDLGLAVTFLPIMALGRYTEAETELRAALEISLRAVSPEHERVVAVRFGLSLCLEALGKHEEALMQLRIGLAVAERLYGYDHPRVAVRRLQLAKRLVRQDRFTEAEREASVALKALRRGDEDLPGLPSAYQQLAETLSGQGQHERAGAALEQALEHARRRGVRSTR